MNTTAQHPIPAISGVIIQAGRVLLVRRCNPPNAGKLALPGGKIQWGEAPLAAVQRELLEETQLQVKPIQLLDAVATYEHSAGKLTREYIIISYLCRVTGGVAAAQDDACELVWLTEAELAACNSTCPSVVAVAKKGFRAQGN